MATTWNVQSASKGGFRPGTGSSFPPPELASISGQGAQTPAASGVSSTMSGNNARGFGGPVQQGGMTPVTPLPGIVPMPGTMPSFGPPPINLDAGQNPNLGAFGDEATRRMGAVDPFLQESINNYRQRMSEDTTRRATTQMQGAADDSFAATTQALRERAAVGGTVGSGQEAGQVAAASDANERNKVAGAAQIQNAQQQRLDSLTAGMAGALQQPSQNQLQWGAQAGANAQAQAQNQLAQQQIQLQAAEAARAAQTAQLNAMMNLWNMGGMPGGGGGGGAGGGMMQPPPAAPAAPRPRAPGARGFAPRV